MPKILPVIEEGVVVSYGFPDMRLRGLDGVMISVNGDGRLVCVRIGGLGTKWVPAWYLIYPHR